MSDTYAEMKRALMALWNCLIDMPEKRSVVDQKIKTINQLAQKIGGRISRDAVRLISDVGRFLEGNLTRDEIDRMFQEALKLEQDTREL